MSKTFEEWRAEVDRIIQQRLGVGLDDLPDVPLRDWYEDGYRTTQAAVAAWKYARE